MFFVRPDVKSITAFPTSRYRLPTNPCQTGTCYFDRKAQATVGVFCVPTFPQHRVQPSYDVFTFDSLHPFYLLQKRYRYKITKQRGAE